MKKTTNDPQLRQDIIDLSNQLAKTLFRVWPQPVYMKRSGAKMYYSEDELKRALKRRARGTIYELHGFLPWCQVFYTVGGGMFKVILNFHNDIYIYDALKDEVYSITKGIII